MALISLGVIEIKLVHGNNFKSQFKVIEEWLFDGLLEWEPDHLSVDLELVGKIAGLKYGISIVAHPGKTIEELQNLNIKQPVAFSTLESMFDDLLRLGIKGLEIEYRGYAENKTFYNDKMLKYVNSALKRGASLFTTAGSDFHGPPEVSF